MPGPGFGPAEETGAGRALYILSSGLLLMSAFSLVQSWIYGGRAPHSRWPAKFSA
jgi:hypothetical protein